MQAETRAWIILVGILLIELVPFTFVLVLSPTGVIDRLYGFQSAQLLVWVGALAITAGYVGYSVHAFLLIRQNLLTVNAMKLAAVPFAIVTGTVEEVYFRKFLMDWAAHQGIAAVGQVVLSGALFGVAHGIWGLFARQWRMALGAAIATGLLGLLLAIVYLVAGRHVAPCIWAHMLINLAIEPWMILAAASGGVAMRRSSSLA